MNTERPRIAGVIVCYDEEPEQIVGAVESLFAQSLPASEVIIVDNGPGGRLAARLDGCAPGVVAIQSGRDGGYGRAVNIGARRTSADYVVCLNPDARADARCLERLVAEADGDERVAVVGAQVLLADGETCNAGANPLHPTGISPSGGYGEPREHGEPRDVIVVSGACMLLRRSAFLALGGFIEDFFLYYEDVNLCWRQFLAGHRIVYCPEATVAHDYEFGGRPQKWLLLERNRLFSVLANYELRTLLLLTPLLLATELGLLAVAALGGWLPQKLRAYGSLLAARRVLRSSRRAVRASRRRSDAEVLDLLEDRLDSALLPAAATRLANLFCVPYMRLVRRGVG